ncbi:hypothetical protein POV27_04395 [Aureisphaera galaxeae]|uniref:hypothetical protein n=1 Tax=Aureisphaera galaxeae TaxID=1538023 RepID=UPI002350AD8D|nr:hypothetical protein [Aureisphaera galaxeae]MDC8003276.1 hypothetical protein [Aureisphaera galaxeae]
MKATYIFRIILMVLAFGCYSANYAQIGIGTQTPEGALDVSDDNHGIIYPRIALTDYTVQSPVVNPNGGSVATGTVVYNTALTTSGSSDVSPGLYAWNGSRWEAQFVRFDYEKFEQTSAPFRTTIRESYSDPQPGDSDNIPGLTNQTFTPEFSGYYRVEVRANFACGELSDFQSVDDISLATTEGAIFFTMSGTGVDIDPSSSFYSNDEGWLYMHSYGVETDVVSPSVVSQGFVHYASSVYYLYLRGGHNYTFTLSNCINTGHNYFVNNGDTGTGQGYIGLEMPCTVEFNFIGD